jgi:hypothetical protein
MAPLSRLLLFGLLPSQGAAPLPNCFEQATLWQRVALRQQVFNEA